MNFHVKHFTCLIYPTIFGSQDSYYEHSGKVYCHHHYSTQIAVKCTGCQTAILKQFVEINRNNTDEHWHPEWCKKDEYHSRIIIISRWFSPLFKNLHSNRSNKRIKIRKRI